jgi:hypothetical protein
MNARSLPVCGLLVGLLLAAGCQRLNFEKEYKIPPAETQFVTPDAPSYEQKVTVEVHSPGAPLMVVLVKSDGTEDAEKAVKALADGKNPDKVLARQDKAAEDVRLEATVPAKTVYTVVLYNPGKTTATAKVKLTGR